MKFLFFCFSISLFAEVSILSLGNLGSVRYSSDTCHLLQIERLSPSGEVMYTHAYHYDEGGKLISESLIGDLGEVFYEEEIVKSPFSLEICKYDEHYNLMKYSLDVISKEYAYSACNQMISEDTTQCQYDLSGNVSKICDDSYIYDEKKT